MYKLENLGDLDMMFRSPGFFMLDFKISRCIFCKYEKNCSLPIRVVLDFLTYIPKYDIFKV